MQKSAVLYLNSLSIRWDDLHDVRTSMTSNVQTPRNSTILDDEWRSRFESRDWCNWTWLISELKIDNHHPSDNHWLVLSSFLIVFFPTVFIWMWKAQYLTKKEEEKNSHDDVYRSCKEFSFFWYRHLSVFFLSSVVNLWVVYLYMVV